MHDRRLGAEDQGAVERTLPTDAAPGRRRSRERHTRRIVMGLTGLLGAAWALVVASRYAIH